MGKWKKSSEELVEKFAASMDQFDVDHRKMFGYPCCFLNGNMFTGLHEENWVLRLSESDRKELKETHDAQIFAPMKGRIMKEYLILPPVILESTELLASWINRSIAFVESLPAK